ncbi:Fur family zinc uptake transcriptional regulator [Paraperlucidibaca baekdonensis]|uniref:Fur family zinc uptake transcriptional regulator n=1 Tax=Paraperlucidibaca baekdonensis TaxID=748120 RepID=A0A3E0H8N1_9GAMM|nr:transcriptional repressor [Paraperlucidibaca baekdonensis]REH40086.1 Fur family zinc uptake transcriptional regulator [Paraperlucidibaca baekdonensis]
MPAVFRPLSAPDPEHGTPAQRSPALAHDHSRCVNSALASAERLCLAAGARLTPLRKRVLELVWASHKPLGAYELLDQLAQEGHKPAPPTIYRALDFLLQHQLVHRITSLNAFLGCTHPEHAHGGYFLICQHCNTAQELDAVAGITSAIDAATAAANFTVTHGALELMGTCQACQHSAELSHDKN